jgi:hypothetical protein
MRTGRYSMAELFGNRHIEQLVIPEIQRDYVWRPNQVEHLLASILGNFKAWQQEKVEPSLKVIQANQKKGEELPSDTIQSLQDEFAAFHARRTHATNVGFVYAYCDGDLPGQYYLIDGQQRLTTLFLALLAVAARNAELKERFRARYCLSSLEPSGREGAVLTKLDYRLREYTAEFLHRCVDYFLGDPAATGQMKEQIWYLQRFERDTTIRNLFDNYATIQKLIEPALLDAGPANLYEYLEDLVECWYFDTNESAQGEELYIYLNARGEIIAGNENLKARLLEKAGAATAKGTWGRTWEEWQDYFWQKRKVGLSEKVVNPNADRGFDSFLSCIENLEKLQKKGVGIKEPVNLVIIDKYLRVLRWLEDQKAQFKNAYTYADWIESWFSEFWAIFNQPDVTEWAASLSDSNKSTDHNRMVLVWGSLLCVVCALEKESGEWEKLDREQVFRAIRIFYLRYQNFGRAVASLPETVQGILSETPEVLGTEEDATEERAKWEFLKDRSEAERRDLEAVIWEIEDHPLNLNGRDFSGVNLTHLVDLNKPHTSLTQLQNIRDKFNELFPLEENIQGRFDDKKKKVASVLLYYGRFWNRVTPWYYENYDLGDWPRTIRGKGSEENKNGSGTIFRRFFDEFKLAGRSLDELLEQKRNSVPVDPKSETDLRKALIWYSERLKSRFLEKGMYVAKETNMEKGTDAHFPDLCTLWNIKRYFRGGYQKMADQIEEDTK